MAQRYFVAIPIPKEIVQYLDVLCVQLTGHHSPVRFHHTTLVPPFMLKNTVDIQQCIDVVHSISLQPLEASVKSVGTFHQLDRIILIGHVEPNDVLAVYAEQLSTALTPYIELDVTPYTNGVIPPFEAHTTIDYHATLLVPETQISSILVEKNAWSVTKFGLYKEIEQGVWEKV